MEEKEERKEKKMDKLYTRYLDLYTWSSRDWQTRGLKNPTKQNVISVRPDTLHNNLKYFFGLEEYKSLMLKISKWGEKVEHLMVTPREAVICLSLGIGITLDKDKFKTYSVSKSLIKNLKVYFTETLKSGTGLFSKPNYQLMKNTFIMTLMMTSVKDLMVAKKLYNEVSWESVLPTDDFKIALASLIGQEIPMTKHSEEKEKAEDKVVSLQFANISNTVSHVKSLIETSLDILNSEISKDPKEPLKNVVNLLSEIDSALSDTNKTAIISSLATIQEKGLTEATIKENVAGDKPITEQAQNLLKAVTATIPDAPTAPVMTPKVKIEPGAIKKEDLQGQLNNLKKATENMKEGTKEVIQGTESGADIQGALARALEARRIVIEGEKTGELDPEWDFYLLPRSRLGSSSSTYNELANLMRKRSLERKYA